MEKYNLKTIFILLIALIKINVQDINKCNILISFNEDFNNKTFKKSLTKFLNGLTFKSNSQQKLFIKTFFKSFNFNLVPRLNKTQLKKHALLGLYDAGITFKQKNNKQNYYICAGNGFNLSNLKNEQLLNEIKSLDEINSEKLLKFLLTERKKQNIYPLNKNDIIKKDRHIKYLLNRYKS